MCPCLQPQQQRRVQGRYHHADGDERPPQRPRVGMAAHDGRRAREPDLHENRDGQLQREQRLAPDQAGEGVLHQKAGGDGARKRQRHAHRGVAVVDVVLLAEHAGADGARRHAGRDAG